MSKNYIIKEKLKRILNANPESLFPHFANNEFLSMWWVSPTPFGIPFLYQFHSRIEALVWVIICKFQHHFSIISKFVCCDCYLKKNVAFILISFAAQKWDDCLSGQGSFELPVKIPVQLLQELEVNWLDQNVNKLEFELPRT